MKYIINKKNDKYKSNKRLIFEGGFGFNKKIQITIYNEDMIKGIINNKIRTKLNKITVLNMLYENDEDDDSTGRLARIKIEELRCILLGEYKEFIGEKKINSLLKDLDKLEKSYKQEKKVRLRWQEMT